MKKALFLTLVFTLIAVAKTWSQTDPSPATKPAKDKTEQMQKAEEKSGGAAYSGKGKGGDKDMVEKEKKSGKKKAKKAHKNKQKDKQKDKVKEGEKAETPSEDAPEAGGKTKPQPKKLEPKEKTTEPATTTPKPKKGTSDNK